MSTETPPTTGPVAASATLPEHAWRRPLGLPIERPVRPRLEDTPPLIDDGPWGGIPLGGLGAGSIGRTHRGDFARWHLEPGRHTFESLPACAFSVATWRPGEAPAAHVLSTIRPDTLRSWAWDLPVGAGTYHARFPYAWYEYAWDQLPLELVERQWSPLIPGDHDASSLPVGIIEWTLTNPANQPLNVGLLLTFQDVIGRWAGADRRGGHQHVAHREPGLAGVVMHGPADAADESWWGSFALGAVVDRAATSRCVSGSTPTVATTCGADFVSDGALDDVTGTPPAAPGEGMAAAVAATIELAPGETRRVTFVLAWDLPTVEFGGGTRWAKRYTRSVGREGTHAWTLARRAATEREAWDAAIAAWQAPILADPGRPDWYKATLFNELYYLVDGGTVWTAGPPRGTGTDEDTRAGKSGHPDDRDDLGHFAMLECFDYPFYNTVDVNFYASWALLLLWPELERSVIRDVAATIALEEPEALTALWDGRPFVRKASGAAPHDLGGPAEDPFLRPNTYRYQDSNVWKDLNSKFVLQVWRDVALLDDLDLARETWPAVVQALDHLAAFDRDDDGLPEHDGVPDQTFDTWSMRGPSAYGGALWLAALRAALALGPLAGADPGTLDQFRARLARGETTFEERLWTGRHYRFDTSDGPSADSIMAASSRASGTRTRPDWAIWSRPSGSSGRCAPSSTRTSWASPTVRWAPSTGCGPTGRSTTRRSSRPRCGSA